MKWLEVDGILINVDTISTMYFFVCDEHRPGINLSIQGSYHEGDYKVSDKPDKELCERYKERMRQFLMDDDIGIWIVDEDKEPFVGPGFTITDVK